MEPLKPKTRQGPEAKIQEAIIKELRFREWLVKETHGNMFQSGFPDLFCSHRKYGSRWVEVKNLPKYSFTPAQHQWFPMFKAHGCGIWILVDSTPEEINKLFLPPNWEYYYNKKNLGF